MRAGEDGRDVPTVGCCLLFARELPESLRHGAVAVTRKGKGRIIVTGNLIRQRDELVALLDGPELNPVLKVKGRRAYEQRTGYPARTLIELIVNLLVHRDYESRDLAEIDVDLGRAVRFSNPGAMSRELQEQLQIAADGCFRPVPTLSQIRNPSIADVFFGMRSMERAGSGLADVEEEMRRAGGDAVFRVDAGQQLFHAELYQPLQAAPGVARPIRPLGLYVLNSLPVTVMPEFVCVARLTAGGVSDLFKRDLSELPMFIVAGGDGLLCFAPKTILTLKLGDLLVGEVNEVARVKMENDPEQRKLLTWLLRKHWEAHLKRFRDRGLFVARKKDRAFFQKFGRKAIIEYDSPKRRGIKREVVKPRADGRWHGNEGIGYEVKFSDGRWAIRVKPFYMFTRRDGMTALPGYERTRRATRRMKFDRNKNVDDDLTFWDRSLANGQPTISIGGIDVDDLILDAAFVTIEVPEIVLLDDSDEYPNRMSS